MANEFRPKRRKPLPIRRLVMFMGIALIALGYGFLSVPPEAALDVATRRAFTGIGLIFAGGALWLGTIFFTG